MVAGIAFLLQGLISYVYPGLRLPLRVMVPGCALAILVIFVWRIVFSAYVLQVVGRDRVLLVGATPLLGEIGRHIEEHPEKGSQVIGYVTGENPPGTRLAGGEVLGGYSRSCGRLSKPHGPIASWWACRSGPMGCRWPSCWICDTPGKPWKKPPAPTRKWPGGFA